jgi:DNA-binding NarL/FixJ family response regulator
VPALRRIFVQDVAASDRPVSPSNRRDLDDLETRRLRAAPLFAAGLQQCEVARRLGVSAVSVHRLA